MNPTDDKQLQAALLKLDRYSADEAMRLRASLMVWRIWCLSGWTLAVVVMVIVTMRRAA